MKTKTEIRDWILENCVDEYGDIDMTNLDFSNFRGNVYLSGMKVKRNLEQSEHEVQGNLFQSDHEVQGNLYQSRHEVQGNLYQSFQTVQGNLTQFGHEVQGDIYTEEPTKILYVANEAKESLGETK